MYLLLQIVRWSTQIRNIFFRFQQHLLKGLVAKMTTISWQSPANLVAAVILAGGQSRRMGQDKALLAWQGQPMLQRVYRVATACTPDVSVYTPWPERYDQLLPNAKFVVESPGGGGPLWALAQVWDQIPSQWLWLLACDLPCLDLLTLQTWLSQLPQRPTTVLALVPQHAAGNWEPLCGFYRQAARPHLATFLAQGGRSFQGWLSQLPAHPLPIPAVLAPMFMNCNTPADLGRQ
jgi:molybdenum cofactor guanylyltransferase